MKNPVASEDVIFSKYTVFSQRRPAYKVVRGEEAAGKRDNVRLIKLQFRREREPDPIRDLFEKEEDDTDFRISIGVDRKGKDVWAEEIDFEGGERYLESDNYDHRDPVLIGLRICRTKK